MLGRGSKHQPMVNTTWLITVLYITNQRMQATIRNIEYSHQDSFIDTKYWSKPPWISRKKHSILTRAAFGQCICVSSISVIHLPTPYPIHRFSSSNGNIWSASKRGSCMEPCHSLLLSKQGMPCLATLSTRKNYKIQSSVPMAHRLLKELLKSS